MANPALGAFNNDSPAGQSLEYGAQDVTIPSSGGSVLYIAEQITHTFFDSDWQETNNSVAVPNKQAGRQKIPEIEIQLQPTGNAGLPNPFAFFQLLAANGATYWWIVSRIVRVVTNDGVPSKLTIAARYRLNGG